MNELFYDSVVHFVESVKVYLPEWADEEIVKYESQTFTTDEEMMALAIHLSARNVSEGTGGPFGAAIFERNLESGKATLISVGVNRVVSLGNSTLHGETVAIQLAQKKLGKFSLNGNIGYQYELFTSCEPCAMCLGATLWSGVSRIVCGATKDDAEAIGFDEGPVFPQSYEYLEKSGVGVKKNVLRDEGAKVLKSYGEIGLIYNGGGDGD